MIYTLDTNFFVDAKNLHFPLEDGRTREFWDWLQSLGSIRKIAVSEMVYDEVQKGNDSLAEWMKHNKKVFVQDTMSHISALPSVLSAYSQGGAEIDEASLEHLKADPYVIAHAVSLNGCVVSGERPNNATSVIRKKIPSICKCLDIPCFTLSRFMWELRSTMP
jgi:hypothetical protein